MKKRTMVLAGLMAVTALLGGCASTGSYSTYSETVHAHHATAGRIHGAAARRRPCLDHRLLELGRRPLRLGAGALGSAAARAAVGGPALGA